MSEINRRGFIAGIAGAALVGVNADAEERVPFVVPENIPTYKWISSEVFVTRSSGMSWRVDGSFHEFSIRNGKYVKDRDTRRTRAEQRRVNKLIRKGKWKGERP